MNKIFAMLCAVCVGFGSMVTLFGCAENSDYKRIINKGTFVVGVTIYDPMDYLDENGEWAGFDAEMAALIADEWGVKVQYDIIKWNNKVAELNSRTIDAIWNGMTADEELGRQIDFSASYAENKQVAVIKKSASETINTEADLINAKIAVERGSAGDTVASEILNATSINRVDAQVNALLEVVSGASDVAVIDYIMADSVVGKGDYENLMIVNPETVAFDREVFAVGLRKNSDLTERINAFFKKYYENGKMTELAEKYGSVALNISSLSLL